MPSFAIVGSATVAQTLDDGQTGFIGPTGTLYVSGAAPVTMTGTSGRSILTVMGAIHRIDMSDSGHAAVEVSGAGSKHIDVVGNAAITSANKSAIRAAAAGAIYITNEGTLQGQLRGVTIDSAIEATILNSGSIIGSTGNAVQLTTSGPGHVVNTGLIYGAVAALTLSGSGAKSIYNSGELMSNATAAISGATVSATVTVTNHGTIWGAVVLGSGADIYDGEAGTVTGAVFGGSGNDTLRGGALREQLFGDGGNDWLYGGGGDDVLQGGAGSDRAYGGTGDDLIHGGTGDDHLVGNDGDDEVHGDEGNDRLYGGRGDDVLFGGADNDTLYGGSGDDTLNGGAGKDELWGGSGADVFLFAEAGHSPMSAARDVIRDFRPGEDKIDLSGIFAGLTFVSRYTGVAGQVRYDASIGRLYADLTGNRASDFSVDLTGRPAITEADLIL